MFDFFLSYVLQLKHTTTATVELVGWPLEGGIQRLDELGWPMEGVGSHRHGWDREKVPRRDRP